MVDLSKRIVNSFKRRYRERYFTKKAPNNDIDVSKALLICSEPRGGSTWLMELLQSIPHSATLWEPLFPERIERVRDLGLGYRQYVPDDADWPELKTYMTDVFSGRVLNHWIACELDRLAQLESAEHIIVKFCRANAMLPWLVNNFQFKLKPIYLVRHPMAVVASQMTHGAWDHVKTTKSLISNRYNELYEENSEYINTLTTQAELLAVQWCLSNVRTLSHAGSQSGWQTIFYEDLVLEPINSLECIFSEWGLPLPSEVRTKTSLASKTTVSGSPLIGEAQLNSWRKKLTESDIANILNVLIYFNLNNYYSDEALPLRRPSFGLDCK